jgi:carbamoyltransferase
MKLLAFYLGHHDSNLALYDGDRLRYIKSERALQVKHHHATLSWVAQVCEAARIVPDAIAFSDGNRNNLGVFGSRIPTYCVDHHFAHTLSAWPLRPTRECDYGVTIDGRGDRSYRISVVANPGSEDPVPLLQSVDNAYCRVFNLIGQALGLRGLEIDFAGKVMGANAYGMVDEEFVALNSNEEVMDHPLTLLNRVPWRGKAVSEQAGFFDIASPSFRGWLASVHRLLGDFIGQIFAKYVPRDAFVVYAGGAAQNTVYNELLNNDYPNLTIPPHCYDGGISLGCLEFLRARFGLPEFCTKGFPFWQDDPDGGFAGPDMIARVAEHIASGKIVGWFQGRGEIGPRALGHRSILFDARRADGKEYLNRTVKRREHWRPYAGSILAPPMDELVASSGTSPYMLRAMPVREEARWKIPAVVHVDGTSRLQTVTPGDKETESFYALISLVHEITGSPAVLNTSMNADGKPILSTPEQALELWRQTPMDVLCIGDTLWEK